MEQFALDAVERLTTRPRAVYDTIGVDPLTPVIGAEVSGLDLSKELSDEQLDEVRRAFLEHHVLVFRDQELSPADHKRFAGYFGELRQMPLTGTDDGDPAILDLTATKESRYVAGEDWHSDGTADAEPALGSMLYVTHPPEIGSGGDTLFANMHLAYDLLSPPMKSFLDGLTAVHDGLIPWQGYTPPPEYVVPKSEHPVVVRHPETGRKLLYVNGGFTSHIAQLSRGESRALLDLLFGLVAREPLLSCRVRWAPNTLVFWDNRCTQHHAIWDYYPHSRHARRISINGGRPRA
ncbi:MULTISPECIES: TauD/TfdA dioxygenase family protein [Streptomyces]|uniref:TauD/TfdA dioxygenase family protein n=1 Tax=Streptomyces TaxID=1883 RepID=UPI00069B37FB|nr:MULTISPECIES: TauD/TfdA family dioxygenase [Streptomyces]MYU56087.1 taurine dioxygenase [Streptomyces sp. SID7805]